VDVKYKIICWTSDQVTSYIFWYASSLPVGYWDVSLHEIFSHWSKCLIMMKWKPQPNSKVGDCSSPLHLSPLVSIHCKCNIFKHHKQFSTSSFVTHVFLQLQHNPSWNSSWCRLVTRLEPSEGLRGGNTGCSYFIWAVGSIDLSCVRPVLAFYNSRLSASLLKNWQSCPSRLISLANHLNIRSKRQSGSIMKQTQLAQFSRS